MNSTCDVEKEEREWLVTQNYFTCLRQHVETLQQPVALTKWPLAPISIGRILPAWAREHLEPDACKNPEIHSDWTILDDKATPCTNRCAQWMERADWSSLGHPSAPGIGVPGTTAFPRGMWGLQGRRKGGWIWGTTALGVFSFTPQRV